MVNDQRLQVGDGIAASDEPSLTIAAEVEAEIVLGVTNLCLNCYRRGNLTRKGRRSFRCNT